jgi:lysophospholipase L1-like esterase
MSRKWRIVLILSLAANLCVVYVAIKALEYRAHINEFLDKYTNVVNDFSGRDRYAGENSKLVSDSLIPGRVVFLGTQVTELWDLRKYFPQYEPVNRGVSGQRVSGFLLRFRPDVIELGPGAVVIEVSSYNFRPYSSVREIEDYVACMAELAAFNGIRPLPATIIPILKDSLIENDYHLLDSLALFNEWLRAYCAKKGYDYIDFNAALADKDGFLRPDYSSAAIDLNEQGYDQISRATREVLEAQIDRSIESRK